ncbi:MAG TPA: YceI family protein [Caulobacteraceae bacterium]|nr:YceI family protein [Caulobacteraceae bacterium]
MLSKGLVRSALLGAVVGMLALGAQAQPMPKAMQDYKAAPAGAYLLDQAHTAIIARVPHLGFSFEVFRFDTVSGALTWDPANAAADSLNVTVDPKSMATASTPIDFAAELTGDKFLNVAKYPTATFVSKAFHPVDATHGKVDGDLTIMGVTQPATFDVELIGAGQFGPRTVIGVKARAMVSLKGLGLPPFIQGPVELDIDTEFDKKPA